jgi:hypothetical protein
MITKSLNYEVWLVVQFDTFLAEKMHMHKLDRKLSWENLDCEVPFVSQLNVTFLSIREAPEETTILQSQIIHVLLHKKNR